VLKAGFHYAHLAWAAGPSGPRFSGDAAASRQLTS
jgi:hypothetical protein